MLSAAIGNGHALNIVKKCVEDIGETGYQLWKRLTEYYLDKS